VEILGGYEMEILFENKVQGGLINAIIRKIQVE